MLTGGKLAITTKQMEQGVIMMDQLRHCRTEETRHMGVEVRLMEEVVATQVVLQVMKPEITQLVGTANLFLMQGQDMAHLPAQLTVDTLNQTRTSPTVNQVGDGQFAILFGIFFVVWKLFLVILRLWLNPKM
jgi:Holliday junction resolvase-like predicted endonuclease